LQKSCELGSKFADLERKQIQLNLDLELAKENLKKAQDEVVVMGGNNSLTICLVIFSFPFFEPSDFTRADVRSENRQLQARLRNVISLDKMKQALERKDLDLAAAQKTAREKTELADKKLASVGKLEEENAKLKTAVDEAKKEVVQLKEEKVALADKVDVLTRKRDELETYLGGLAKKMFLMLEGTFLLSD
jgi:DNA repair exonuclease SbcCD ATPase subunit